MRFANTFMCSEGHRCTAPNLECLDCWSKAMLGKMEVVCGGGSRRPNQQCCGDVWPANLLPGALHQALPGTRHCSAVTELYFVVG